MKKRKLTQTGYRSVPIKTIQGFFAFPLPCDKTEKSVKTWLDLTATHLVDKHYESPF